MHEILSFEELRGIYEYEFDFHALGESSYSELRLLQRHRVVENLSSLGFRKMRGFQPFVLYVILVWIRRATIEPFYFIFRATSPQLVSGDITRSHAAPSSEMSREHQSHTGTDDGISEA